jgi:hypothetical protein
MQWKHKDERWRIERLRKVVEWSVSGREQHQMKRGRNQRKRKQTKKKLR